MSDLNLNVIVPLIRWILQLGLLLFTGYIFCIVIGIFWRVRYKEEPELQRMLRAGRLLFWYGGAVWLYAALIYFGAWFFYGYRTYTEAASLMLWTAPFYMAAAILHVLAASTALWSRETQNPGNGLILRGRITACYLWGLWFLLSAWLFA